MRILYDARSVRTPAGAYVFQGLTRGWRCEDRVSVVLAAVPPGFDSDTIPEGVEPIIVPSGSWLQHLRTELPNAANRAGADIVFVPNGLPPRDPRTVIYFQDLHQFKLGTPGMTVQDRFVELARATWRRHAASVCRLAIPVSTDIHHEVVRRLPIPVTMIPNGVDVGAARWIGGSDRVVVMGGRGARKGEDLALHAWARLTPGIRSNLRLDAIGVEPAARKWELQSLAEQLGIGKNVFFESALPRSVFLERVAGSVLALSCSRLEAFGLPVAEALAMGAPLLASDLPSHRELVARAGAGGLFRAGDVAALAKELTMALQVRMPDRLAKPPLGWSWRDRARQHIDAYHSLT